MPRADAASLVRQMAGRHRLPDALRRADTLARHGLPQHKTEQVAAADAALAKENRRRSLDERGATWRFSASATPGCG
jgi:hypothetical protein